MSRQLPPLNALRAFEAAARHMSFTDAAEELCVTQGAISRQVKALEKRLGVALFTRMTRRIELTAEGEVLYPGARHAFDDIERVLLRILDRGNENVLTISALPTFAMNWLMPRLPDFNEKYPEIEVQLMMTIKPVNFSRDNIDLALRVGNPEGSESKSKSPRIDLVMTEDWNSVTAKKILPDKLVVLASPHFLEKVKKIYSPSDLQGLPLLHVGTRINAWPDWLEAVNASEVDHSKGVVFGHFSQSLLAAKNGHGVALIPKILVEKEIKNNELIVLFDKAVHSDGNYYLLFRSHHWSRPKIKAFQEWIQDITRKPKMFFL